MIASSPIPNLTGQIIWSVSSAVKSVVEWQPSLSRRHWGLILNEPKDKTAILVRKGVEGALITLMRNVEAGFPGIKVFSLPFLGSKEVQRHIELGMRGVPEQVPPAMEAIRRGVVELGYSFDEK